MSKSVILKCNCGCNVAKTDGEHAGWLVLSQVPYTKSNNEGKLRGELHFSSVECLMIWAQKAGTDLPDLRKAAGRNHVRGTFESKEAQGLFV